ncbi:MAG: hypothetical protein AAB568_02380 [Patescibacteria group bacterium]
MKKTMFVVVILAIFVTCCTPCVVSNNEVRHGQIQATVSDVRPVFEGEHLIACSFMANFGSEKAVFRLTGNEGSFGHDNVHLCATLRDGDAVDIYDNGSYYVWNKYSTSRK